MNSKSALRTKLRNIRKAIPAAQRHKAAQRVAARAIRLLRRYRSRRIALYQTLGSELDTAPLLRQLRDPIFLPRTTRRGLQFVARGSRQQLSVKKLDVIFLPLLGFDARGTRLGQGGGHYDRALSFKRCSKRPLFVGLAYEAQYVESLHREAHDVRLDAVITEKKLWRFG